MNQIISTPSATIESKKFNNLEYEFTVKLCLSNVCCICEEKITDGFECLPDVCSASHKHKNTTACFTDLRAMQLFLEDPTMKSYALYCQSCAEKTLEFHANLCSNFKLHNFRTGLVYLECPFCRPVDYNRYATNQEKKFAQYYPESELFGLESVQTTAAHYSNIDSLSDCDCDDCAYYSDYSYSEEEEVFVPNTRGLLNFTKLLRNVSADCKLKLEELCKAAVVKHFSQKFYCPVVGCDVLELQTQSYDEIVKIVRYDDIENYNGEEKHVLHCVKHGSHCVQCQESLANQTWLKHRKECVGIPMQVALAEVEHQFKKCPACFLPLLPPHGCESVICVYCDAKFRWKNVKWWNITKTKKYRSLKTEQRLGELQRLLKEKEQEEKLRKELELFKDVPDEENCRSTRLHDDEKCRAVQQKFSIKNFFHKKN